MPAGHKWASPTVARNYTLTVTGSAGGTAAIGDVVDISATAAGAATVTVAAAAAVAVAAAAICPMSSFKYNIMYSKMLFYLLFIKIIKIYKSNDYLLYYNAN